MLMKHLIRTSIVVLLLLSIKAANAQQITGVWSGKLDKKRVEIKFIQNGDSIAGTSYYYQSGSNYLRYSIKGYLDGSNNSVVWWDDELLSDEGNSAKEVALLSVADFNCPGGGKMMLDGTATPKENHIHTGDLSLTKVFSTTFPDEWDFVIDNYLEGTNDPDIIDSVDLIAKTPKKKQREMNKPTEVATEVVATPVITAAPDPEVALVEHTKKMEQSFTNRKKVFTTEIPVQGDSIELRFFDNVQVDGDSISLFLDGKMMFTHIRLTEKPFTIKIPVNDLHDGSELTMVAENLGAIPPNTAYMVAIVGDKRYEVNLTSTEETSGMIRLRKIGSVTPPTQETSMPPNR
jgi:hypothetical protein